MSLVTTANTAMLFRLERQLKKAIADNQVERNRSLKISKRIFLLDKNIEAGAVWIIPSTFKINSIF
jgi:hypothetical protein